MVKVLQLQHRLAEVIGMTLRLWRGTLRRSHLVRDSSIVIAIYALSLGLLREKAHGEEGALEWC